MHVLTSIRLISAFLYAILPFLCLSLANPLGEGQPQNPLRKLFTGTVAALVAFALVASSVTLFSLDLYIGAHAILTFVGLIAFVRQYRRGMFAGWRNMTPAAWPVFAIIIGAFAVRLAPILWAGHSLGGDDARFHNILATKILVERTIAMTWAPFAHVPVLYPQATHTLVAFLSELADRPIHEAFNILFPIIGALTTGVIYLVAMRVFDNRVSALWAAACYAFLPLWGSLDYYRWGGLPNATGMLFLCFVVLITTENYGAASMQRQMAILGAILCVVAIEMTHHYTLLVAFLFLTSGVAFAADTQLRRTLRTTAGMSLLFCMPLFFAPRLSTIMSPALISVSTFREQPITLLDCIWNLNPIFVVLFVFAVLSTRRIAWNSLQLLTLSWFAGLLTSFVLLEYVYRGATLLLTRFQDCYTGLTPSRLATDLAYPMSILCGFIPLLPVYQARRPLAATLFILAILTTSAITWNEQRRVGVYPEFEEAAQWLRDNTPPDSMVVGNFPHLEYLSWRENSNPPLPASEPRNSPSVMWKKTQSYNEWVLWGAMTKRPLYYLFAPDDSTPPFLQTVFANERIVIMTNN